MEEEVLRQNKVEIRRVEKASGEAKFKDVVIEEYQEFKKEVFDKKAFDKLPPQRPWDHTIELIPKATLKNCKVYLLSIKEQKKLDCFLDKYLKTGHIRSSKSPCAVPFFFVKKKDGSLRPVQDYRQLNEVTIKNKYPLSLIQELIDKVKGAQFFTKLDIQWGYNNVRIREGDEQKAVFRTNRGLFKPLVMYFGLCNSPAIFQLIMDSFFQDLVNKGKIIIYMDDILIFSKTLTEHRVIVRRVLRILNNNKLLVQTKKCQFYQTKIDYLGIIISKDSIEVDPEKIKRVTDWPKPRDKHKI